MELLNRVPDAFSDFDLTELGSIARSYDDVYCKSPVGHWFKTNFGEARSLAVCRWRVSKYFMPIALEPQDG